MNCCVGMVYKRANAQDFFWYLSHPRAANAQASLHVQTRQSLSCPHAQSMDVDECQDQNLNLHLVSYSGYITSLDKQHFLA